MKPMETGGWVAQGNDEIMAITAGLQAVGESDLLRQLGTQFVGYREMVLRAHPEWDPDMVSSTMLKLLADDDYQAARITYAPELPMPEEQSGAVIDALRKATRRRTQLDHSHRVVARDMVRVFDQAKQAAKSKSISY
ncbi:MAG TPA: hypothetical protein VMR08_03705 [Patescibacteria group bacterium]|jgi:hypothetical protein|nr:hypothetical protein [Patescibacteria group bacterium]